MKVGRKENTPFDRKQFPYKHKKQKLIQWNDKKINLNFILFKVDRGEVALSLNNQPCKEIAKKRRALKVSPHFSIKLFIDD